MDDRQEAADDADDDMYAKWQDIGDYENHRLKNGCCEDRVGYGSAWSITRVGRCDG